MLSFVFFFNDTATTEIYTLSLHDALPICARLERPCLLDATDARRRARAAGGLRGRDVRGGGEGGPGTRRLGRGDVDRKSTRLNSSHANISYAVFCLKKKKEINLFGNLLRS